MLHLVENNAGRACSDDQLSPDVRWLASSCNNELFCAVDGMISATFFRDPLMVVLCHDLLYFRYVSALASNIDDIPGTVKNPATDVA
jgi:hypothetical protein